MGWNSWDSYGATVTEAEVRQNADYMARHMREHGWEYVVVDIRWHVDDAGDDNYNFNTKTHNYDANGILIPSLIRFPSAKDGSFSRLASDVHAMGLKFGVHLMRGINRQFYDAVDKTRRIGDSPYTFGDLKVRGDGAGWLPDNYGIEQNPAGQAWMDLMVSTYASWGIDFVKVDDLSFPYHTGEVEMLHNAIMAVKRGTGKEILLSTSPGPTPLDPEVARHVQAHANMWRVTGDMWDKWDDVYAIFEKAKSWTPYRVEGAWPDNDMLALGTIGIRAHDFWLPVKGKRDSALTDDEEKSLLSLWFISRSPLMFGGDWTLTKPSMIEMLSNDEALAVDQYSSNNREIFREDDLIAWAADKPGSNVKYVALFNARDTNFDPDVRAAWKSGVIRKEDEPVDVKVDIRGARRLALSVGDGGDDFSYDHAAWINPVLHGPKGDLPLTSLKWTVATAGWGAVRVDRTIEDQPLTLNGQPVKGIGAHSRSLIVYDLPQGYETFTAEAALTNHGSVNFSVMTDMPKGKGSVPDTNDVTIRFSDLGLSGRVKVRDLWAKRDLGVFTESFTQTLPFHGGGLFSFTPAE